MSQTIYDRYIENEVLSADPHKLVVILYRAAIEAVARARVNLRNGEIRERSNRITKATSIIHELSRSLNHAEGGDISRNLAELYAYMQQRLNEANANQTEPPLEETEVLLRTLLDGWTETARVSAKPVAIPDELQYAEAR
ncbi:MAG: flagellar export chaperone FliS [Bryobacteraceae bacterium]